MRSLVPGYHLGNKNEKSKDYCKPDSEQRVLFFHNKISGGHTSLLQVYKCYCSSTVLVQVYKCYLGNTIVYRQCWKERFKIYKATKIENCQEPIWWAPEIVHFKQLRRVAKFYRGLYLVGKLARLYTAAVLLIPRGLYGLGHVVRAHDLTVRGGWFLHRRRERGALLRLPYPPF